jgi:3-methyladenine DNA glycosylase AlkD
VTADRSKEDIVELQETLHQLESLGTEQNRKTYRRHGVGENLYGVSWADLGKLQKKIKKDHALAVKLWATGNHDARILATMIADSKVMTSEELDAWAGSLTNYTETDAFSKLAAGSPLIREKIDRWTAADHEWIESAGWNLLAHLALGKNGDVPDDYYEKHLALIETDLHNRKNRVRYAMNSALIAIGGRNERLMEKALAAAAKIGKVEVDHGETGCKTPQAAEYIQKMAARKKK